MKQTKTSMFSEAGCPISVAPLPKPPICHLSNSTYYVAYLFFNLPVSCLFPASIDTLDLSGY